MHAGFKWFAAGLPPVVSVFLGMLSLVAHADETQKPWESEPQPYVLEDRLRMQVAVWNAKIDTTLRVDGTPTQAGTTLNAERDLALGSKKLMPDVELSLFPGERHLLRLGVFTSRRNNQTKLTSTVNFGKDVFNPGDTVNSTLDINMVGLGYGYRVLKDRRYELDAELRVQVATFSDNMQCSLCAPRAAGQPQPNYNRQPDTITLPLPMVGGEGRVQLYKRLDFTARYYWLAATVVDTHGEIRDWQAGLLYHYRQNFGISLEYRAYNTHVDSNSNDHPGTLDMRYRGWQLGFRGSL